MSQAAQPSSVNDRTSVRSELRRTMEDLSSREAQIIEMRFGLADGNPMTLEEIGKHFRVTRERIRQVSGDLLTLCADTLIDDVFDSRALLSSSFLLLFIFSFLSYLHLLMFSSLLFYHQHSSSMTSYSLLPFTLLSCHLILSSPISSYPVCVHCNVLYCTV